MALDAGVRAGSARARHPAPRQARRMLTEHVYGRTEHAARTTGRLLELARYYARSAAL